MIKWTVFPMYCSALFFHNLFRDPFPNGQPPAAVYVRSGTSMTPSIRTMSLLRPLATYDATTIHGGFKVLCWRHFLAGRRRVCVSAFRALMRTSTYFIIFKICYQTLKNCNYFVPAADKSIFQKKQKTVQKQKTSKRQNKGQKKSKKTAMNLGLASWQSTSAR